MADYHRLKQDEADMTSPSETPSKNLHIVWRGINVVMTIFFLLSTFVNINDSDWYLWVPIYLIPALLAAAIVVSVSCTEINRLKLNIEENNRDTYHPAWRAIGTVHFALCLAYCIYLSVVIAEILLREIQNPLQHEEGREFFGLLITLGWLLCCRFSSFGSNKPTKGLASTLLLVTAVLSLVPLFIWSLCFIGFHDTLGHCIGMFHSKPISTL